MQHGLSLIRFRVATRILLPCLLVATAALLPGDASATSFAPVWTADIENSSAGAHSALTFNLHIPSPDSQLGSAVSFIPPGFGVTNGDSLTNGAISGHVSATATLGLIGGACSTTLDLTFDLMDASTDPLNTIHLYDGVYDYDGDGLPENVDRYPSSLAFIAPDIVPVQRLYGQVPVSGVQVPINFAVFAPGTPLPLLPDLDPALGYPTVAIIGDPLAVPEANFPISDFCTPLTTAVMVRGLTADNPALAGNESGEIIRTNPDAGHYNVILFARGRRDADDDGIENGLDSCPLTPDPNWDPRSGGPAGDADTDGLPDSCDPNDSLHNLDNDGDSFNNRLDLCPQVATTYVHFDADRDGIGDQCDPQPADETNGGAAHRHELCLSDTVVIGSPGPGTPPPWSCPSGPDLPIPPRLILYPTGGVEAVGSVHSVYVSASKPAGAGGAVGVTVNFEISGANPQTGSCLTSNYGDCEFNYLGANEGEDTIVATATIDGTTVSRTVSNIWVGPPPNDDFASASPVTSLPFADVELPLAATTQTGEVAPCGGGELSNTVWYAFTPSEKVLITAQAETNSAYLMLAAYTGTSLNDLSMVQCGSTGQFSGGNDATAAAYFYRASISFWAQAGVTYYFQSGSQLGGFWGYPEMQFSIKETALGDADCSGAINAVDALGVLRKSAGLSAPPCVGAADVNCSGGLNSVDALLILRTSAGLIPKPTTCP